jgi:hypothetical protein
LVLRNINTGQFEVYDVGGNALVGAASLGTVGLDWQLGGFGGGSGAAENLNAAPLSADTSRETFVTTPQHA